MQLPSVDRQPGTRPAGTDLAPVNGPKVIPLLPVNPGLPAHALGVVNNISDSAALARANPVYSSAGDPAQRGSQATSPKDWTIQRPAPEKVETPPPEPISRLLLEFLQSMWRASGSAIEMAQAQNLNNPSAVPGQLARADLTYSPGRIKKSERL